MIRSVSEKAKVSQALLHAIVQTESAYNARAKSSAGAVGLMQLMPGTAERYGVADIWDPAQNLEGGAHYLRDLLDMFQNNLKLALAAYNAGEGAVKKYGNKIPPYPETRDYVRKVIAKYLSERKRGKS
jgi:soluble lytic murein transglycosylase-like protein